MSYATYLRHAAAKHRRQFLMRLKLLRKKLGFTLETLAREAELTKSYVSKVERGVSSPSIEVAMRLARAMNVQVEELFSEDADGETSYYSVVRAAERGALAGGEQGLRYASLADRMSERRLLPFVLYPQRDFNKSAFKEHLGEEFVFVHRGEVEVDFGTERLRLACGDALHFNAQKPHRIRSVGEEKAELLIVVSSNE